MAFVVLAAPLSSKSSAREGKCDANVKMTIDRRTCLRRAAGTALALALPALPDSLAAMYAADTKSDSFAPKGDLTKVQA